MGKSLRDYCAEQDRNELLEQWHPTKNEPLTPDQLTYGSHRRVWWQCEKGHEWQSAVYARTCSHAGCPVCAGVRARQRPPKAGDSLLAARPELAAQWHPEKNGSLTPEQVSPGSHTRAWWQCEKGHEWEATVKSRSEGGKCPICARRQVLAGENDLATTHPQLAVQWHPTKNGSLLPRDVMAGNRRKAWWQCPRGHEWSASIAARASSGSGCPVCAGKTVLPGENDLASAFADIAAQWHAGKNGPLTPEMVTPYSNRKVWWRCEKGHEYEGQISARTTCGAGCPYCAGKKVLLGFNDLATRDPELAKQWHPTLNGSLTARMVTVGSRKRVWWQCDQGHVWKAVVSSRATGRKSGCPVCAGKIRSARQRFYEEVERDAVLQRL